MDHMKRTTRISVLALLTLALAACGGGQENGATQQAAEVQKDEARADGVARTPARPGTMFKVDYQIIGTPIVGSPVSVDLEISSAFGEEPIEVAYQIPDSTSLEMTEAQPRRLTAVPLDGESRVRERVTVIPQREGRLYINVSASRRLYINVSASRDGDDGSTATMISIPIHVGNVDTSPVEQGELQTNEDGETVRVLTEE
jgi:hypothetical protein